MVLASQGAWEAWALYEPLLPKLAPAAVVDAVRKRLHGEPAGDLVEGVAVTATALGQRYSVSLTWPDKK